MSTPPNSPPVKRPPSALASREVGDASPLPKKPRLATPSETPEIEGQPPTVLEATPTQSENQHEDQLIPAATPVVKEALKTPCISPELVDECTNLRITLSDVDIRYMSKLKANNSIFVNRTIELRDLFNTNAECNQVSGSERVELQEYAVPVAAMTYGAGKSALGDNYLPEMRKWAKGDNLDEDQQAALQFLKDQGHHDQLQALCADDTLSVRINSDISLNLNLRAIYRMLVHCTPTWKQDIPEANDAMIDSLKYLIPFIRKTRAIFIMVDEIGEMEGDKDIHNLRTFFVNIHVDNARSQDPTQAKPLHFYVCGRVNRDIAVRMANSLTSGSPYNWHSLVLEPLQAKHVRQIRERLDLSFSTDNRVNEMAEELIVKQTAGVPRQIWRVLTAAKVLDLKFGSVDHARTRLKELCHVLAGHEMLRSDLVNLREFGLSNEYTKMHLMSITNTLTEYPICSRYLPLTLKQVSSEGGRKLYQVQTAPLFTIGLSKEMAKAFKDLDKNLWLSQWLPSKYQANEQELLVMQAIYRRIISHGLAKTLASEWKVQVPPLTLKALLPFLQNDDKIPDQELPDVPLDQCASKLPKAYKDHAQENKFQALIEARAHEKIDPRVGKVFQTPAGSSAADFIIDFPLVDPEKPGIRLVEVQSKATQLQDNATSPKVLRDDCCKKCTLSPNPNEFTLHILSAQKTTGPLQKETKDRPLVLTPGQCMTFEPGKKGASSVQVTVPKQMYLVVLSPKANQQWLSPNLDPHWFAATHSDSPSVLKE